MQPVPTLGKSSGLKRKLDDTTLKEEETVETHKKKRQEVTSNKVVNTTPQNGGGVLPGQSAGSATLVLPLKPGRPLVNTLQANARPSYGPQVAPASFMIS